MLFMDVKDFSFNGETLRGFIIKEINGDPFEITDIVVKFQINRAIVFDIVINFHNNETNEIETIKGSYYKYDFFATIKKIEKTGSNHKFLRYRVIIDLIEFSKKNEFFINSDKKFNLEIIPTNNMVSYLEEIDKRDLFIFEDISYDEYDEKYRYLIELNSLIYKTPILIEKLYFYKEDILNKVFQSQYINEGIIKVLNENYFIYFNNYFNLNLEKYLDNYLKLKSKDDLVNILLSQYLIYDVFSGKEKYNLNDISGFIDLFDGIFFKLDGTLEKKEFLCSECNKKVKTKQKYKSLEKKIEYILDYLEPELKKYEIDQTRNLTKTLAHFRNMVRHQNTYEEFDLEKLFNFSKNILRLYALRYILNMNTEDYNMDKILKDFNIFPLVLHRYKYQENEFLLYDTNLNKMNRNFKTGNFIFSILKEQEYFKNASQEDFIYLDKESQEIKKIFLDRNKNIDYTFLTFGIIVFNKEILKPKNNNIYKFDYTEFKEKILDKNIKKEEK